MSWFKSNAAEQRSRPRIFVAPDKFIKGATHPEDFSDDEIGRMASVDWHGAWDGSYSTDAHCVCYQVSLDNAQELRRARRAKGVLFEKDCPRLKKDAPHALGPLGVKVELGLMLFDFDLEGHQPWKDEAQLFQVIERLLSLEDTWPIMGRWSVIYGTRCGFRVVFALSEPVSPIAYEAHYRWMVNQFHLRGWEMDPIWDWTRMFRLPNVRRDRKQTGEEFYAEVLHNDATLPPTMMGRIDKSDRMSDRARQHLAEHGQAHQPTNFKAMALVGEGSKNRPLWYREARKVLRSREPYDYLFGHKDLEAGSRNNTLMRLVAITCGAINHLNNELPEDQLIDEARVYALFVDLIGRLEEDEPASWSDTCWRFVTSIWPKEEAKRLAFVEELADRELSAQDRLLSILKKVRLWWKDPELNQDDEASLEVLKTRLLVICGKSIHILRPDGYYDCAASTRDTLIPRIKRMGMEEIFPIQFLTGKGTLRYRTPADLVNDHGYCVSGSTGMAQIGGGMVDPDQDVFVQEIYSRSRALTPCFDGRVDGWLRAMFGMHWPRVEQWLAYSLAFEDGPICALSIKADPDVGKGMLIQGLVEAASGKRASIDDMFSNHNESFCYSPWLIVDEGWPRAQKGKAAADTFREIVGGSPITINPKYLSPVVINNPMRVVFTANNVSVVKELTRGKDLSREDRAALSQRILHVELDDSGACWLRKQRADGRSRIYTSGWVQGGSGEPSQFIVARHLLWLYENRRDPKARGARLLVEGDPGGELMRHMRVDSGIAPLIVESILSLCKSKCGLLHERTAQPLAVEGVLVSGEVIPVVWLTTQMVLGYYRSNLRSETKVAIRSQSVHSVLQSLSAFNKVSGKRKGWTGISTWYRLSVNELIEVAQRDGLDYTKLEKLAQEACEATAEAGANLNPSTGIRIKTEAP